jgi:hypothetical protein
VPPTARHAGERCPAVGEGARRAARAGGTPSGRRRSSTSRDELRLAVGRAIEALNRGAALAGCLHNTGEGALSPYHRNGGDLVFQIGTSYFGCRDEHGRFDLERLKDLVAGAPVRAIEIKLSQGAKPGLGGMLPGAKVTQEIAEIRGIPSRARTAPARRRHAAFSDVDSMLDFVELLAAETGLPVGIKSAVGDLGFWDELVRRWPDRRRGVDFVTSTAARAAPARRR